MFIAAKKSRRKIVAFCRKKRKEKKRNYIRNQQNKRKHMRVKNLKNLKTVYMELIEKSANETQNQKQIKLPNKNILKHTESI